MTALLAESLNARRTSDRRFYGGMAVALAILVFVGFAPSFYLQSFHPEARHLTQLVYVHGVAFSAWIVLLLTQLALVAAGRPDIHRRLGVFGLALAVAMCCLGAATALAVAARLLPGQGAAAAGNAALALCDLPVFAGLVGAGVVLRRTPEAHKRLMLLATVAIIGAAVNRLPLPALLAGRAVRFVLADLFCLSMMGWDLASTKRIHPASLVGSFAILLDQIAQTALRDSEGWAQGIAWLLQR